MHPVPFIPSCFKVFAAAKLRDSRGFEQLFFEKTSAVLENYLETPGTRLIFPAPFFIIEGMPTVRRAGNRAGENREAG